jgi:hypothetical protein
MRSRNLAAARNERGDTAARQRWLSSLTLLAAAACSEDTSPQAGGAASDAEALYATSTVVSNAESAVTYVSVLDSLDTQKLDLSQALEASGFAEIKANAGKLFVTNGEAPVMTRYEVSGPGGVREDGLIDFANEGAEIADSTFVADDKAYASGVGMVTWNPETMEILGSIEIPREDALAGGLEHSGLLAGRSVVVRPHRAYYATNWANWDEYDVAEDSLIYVIDTDKDEVIEKLEVPCPYLDIASVDENDNIYFSNWTYSLAPTLLHGKRKACAVRILAGEDKLDEDWSLTFADVTEGREAAALRCLGDNQALISVFHHEDAELEGAASDSLADSAHWRFWKVDLESREASELTELGTHSGGFNTARVDGRNFVLVPRDTYTSTEVYELPADGEPELRWTVSGWSTTLLRVR